MHSVPLALFHREKRETKEYDNALDSTWRKFFLNMCHWPLRAPTPLYIVYYVAILQTTSWSLVEKNSFCNPNLVTFSLFIYLIEPKTTS